MPEYRKILVPIDGSVNSARAVKHAGYLAEKCGAEISVLHVVNLFSKVAAFGDVSAGVYIPDKVVDDIKEAGNSVINEALSKLPAGVVAEGFIEVGSPTEVIVNFCTDKGFDLIVMGSRGLGIIKEFIMGSVSSSVLYYASCPVMVVK